MGVWVCVEGLGARRGDQEDFIHKDSRIAGLQGQGAAHCRASNTHAARVAARHTNRIGTKSFVQTISRERKKHSNAPTLAVRGQVRAAVPCRCWRAPAMCRIVPGLGFNNITRGDVV